MFKKFCLNEIKIFLINITYLNIIYTQGYSRAVFTGTFTVWQEFLLEKESVFWSTIRLFDSLLRGFSQVSSLYIFLINV